MAVKILRVDEQKRVHVSMLEVRCPLGFGVAKGGGFMAQGISASLMVVKFCEANENDFVLGLSNRLFLDSNKWFLEICFLFETLVFFSHSSDPCLVRTPTLALKIAPSGRPRDSENLETHWISLGFLLFLLSSDLPGGSLRQPLVLGHESQQRVV